jgi:aspartate aminotransferase-like enzyme
MEQVKVKSNDDMILFSVGPVEIDPDIRRIGGDRLPYFRTEEFSDMNRRMASMIKQSVHAEDDSQVVFLTASGTGAMEAAVINTFAGSDRLLVIVGGSFGRRFADICEIHGLEHTVLELKQGQALTEKSLQPYRGRGFSGLLVNAHETSTGVLYDLPMISRFCQQEGLLLVVDAISSFLADPYYMKQWNIDITILSTQKALGLPPGLSILVVGGRAIERIRRRRAASLYFNLDLYFDNMRRGQTPFTPAIGILLQLRSRLEQIEKQGQNSIIEHTAALARNFRNRIKDLPFDIPSESLSNALTPLQPQNNVSAYEIYFHLKENYKIIVCPNGGALRHRLFRVGHMGYLTVDDNTRLINAFLEMQAEGLI